jgi:hypothetical protein
MQDGAPVAFESRNPQSMLGQAGEARQLLRETAMRRDPECWSSRDPGAADGSRREASPPRPLPTGGGARLIATRLLGGAMPGPGRNDPCPCGSGRKVKRCCEQQRGPSEEQLARAHVALLARNAARDISHLPDDALHGARRPARDRPDAARRAAQADRPRPATPARQRRRRRPRLGHRGADPRRRGHRHLPATSATRRCTGAAARPTAHHALPGGGRDF